MSKATRKFSPRWAESQTGLLTRMNGAPVGGFYSEKIGFDTELLLAKRPPDIVNTRILERPKRFAPAKKSVGMPCPLALDLLKIPHTEYHQDILATTDHTGQVWISVLVMQGNRSIPHPTRDTDADHVWYVHRGRGTCYTDLGAFSYDEGMFIYVPRGVLSYFLPTNTQEQTMMVGMQSTKGLRVAKHGAYANTHVPFNEHAMILPQPYDPEKIGAQDLVHAVYVRRAGGWSRVEYRETPLTCVAWNGKTYPFAIEANRLNFAYTTSIHPDPTNFALFATEDMSAMVSVLGPRFVHSLPFYHLGNYDEFLFYAKPYGARAGSKGGVGEAGTATLHPQGVEHGPQPQAMEDWEEPASPADMPYDKGLAVMFETASSMQLIERKPEYLIRGYEKSWARQ